MSPTTVPVADAARLWSRIAKGNLVLYPFRRGRVWTVTEVHANGDVDLEPYDGRVST